MPIGANRWVEEKSALSYQKLNHVFCALSFIIFYFLSNINEKTTYNRRHKTFWSLELSPLEELNNRIFKKIPLIERLQSWGALGLE